MAAKAVGDDQLRAAYRRQRGDFTQLHAAHILLPTEQEANRVAKEVTPENFAELAKKYSIDKVSGQRGGDLGTTPLGSSTPTSSGARSRSSPGRSARRCNPGSVGTSSS